MKHPQISAVIPTFMEENYIGKLLSKLAKTQPQIEIIIVDSKSHDKTTQIAKHYINKIYEITERGIAKAKNYGAKKAKANILVFIDADIIPTANFAIKLLQTFNNTQVVGATCNVILLQAKFTEIAFSKFYNQLLQIVSKFKPHSQGKFFAVRRDAFFKVNGFNENLPCLEDQDLAFRLSKHGKIAYVKDLIVYESPRRFRKQGLPKVVTKWFLDYLSYILRGKTISKAYSTAR